MSPDLGRTLVPANLTGVNRMKFENGQLRLKKDLLGSSFGTTIYMTNESNSENHFQNSRFGQSCRMNNFKETFFVGVGSA
jgi:hypothetical protein